MDDERSKKQNRSNDRSAPDRSLAPIVPDIVKMSCKRKGDEDCDQQPAEVQPNLNSRNTPKFDL